MSTNHKEIHTLNGVQVDPKETAQEILEGILGYSLAEINPNDVPMSVEAILCEAELRGARRLAADLWFNPQEGETYEELLRNTAETDKGILRTCYDDGKLNGACRLAMDLGYATGHALTYNELLEYVREQRAEQKSEVDCLRRDNELLLKSIRELTIRVDAFLRNDVYLDWEMSKVALINILSFLKSKFSPGSKP